MTIERLSNYRAICVELNEIKSELRDLETIDAVQTASKFPYSKHTVPVHGLPSGSDIKELRQQEAYLKSEKLIIENFVDSIENKELKLIIKWRYIKGLSWIQTGFKIGLSADACRMKVKRYLKGKKSNFFRSFQICSFCSF